MSIFFNLFIRFHPIDSRLKGDINLGLKRSASSSHKCCYPGCSVNVNLHAVAKIMQYEILQKFSFFILDNVKVCEIHSNTNSWDNINEVATLSSFTREQIEKAIKILQNPMPTHNVSSGNFFL